MFIRQENIAGAIGINFFTLIGILNIFRLKCSSMTIDLNQGVIYVKISKIYSCKKNIYHIDNNTEIDFRANNDGTKTYDIVLILNDGSNVIGATSN